MIKEHREKRREGSIFTNFAITLVLFSLLFSILYPLSSRGQQAPEFMVSWKANSYVPPDYPGKALPSPTSPIEIAFELLENSRIVNLAGNEVRWFINNQLQKSGLGLKTLTYIPLRFERQDKTIRIEVRRYRGANLEETIVIPIAEPEVVITPLADNIFKALPYFFNTASLNQLNFEWTVNGQRPEGTPENPNILELASLPAGININISVLVKNLKQVLESTSNSLNFLSQ